MSTKDHNDLWAKRIAVQNAKRAAALDEHGTQALDGHLRFAAENARKHGLPFVEGGSLSSEPERADRALSSLGALPPISDPKGITNEERVALEHALQLVADRIRARAIDDSEIVELLTTFRRLAMRLGALSTDTPARQRLDRSRAAAASRSHRLEPAWHAPAKQIAKKHREDHPREGATFVAKAIVQGLPADMKRLGFRNIIAAVEKWQKDGTIPPRQK